jgi:hypothetical protein
VKSNRSSASVLKSYLFIVKCKIKVKEKLILVNVDKTSLNEETKTRNTEESVPRYFNISCKNIFNEAADL